MAARRVSVSLALEALHEQMEVCERAEAIATRERQIRNNLIIDARVNGDISYPKLSEITGLTRQALYNIINTARNVIEE
jgi:hypothetical protein